MPLAVTVPEPSLMVMVPAVPPLPMAAMPPLTHVKSLTPSDQLALVVVFQFPPPSVGAPGLAPLASHVSVCAPAEAAQIPMTGKAAKAMSLPLVRERMLLRMIHSPRVRDPQFFKKDMNP